MYGDTSVIRGLARSLRDQAVDIRSETERLVGQADHTYWTGLAADAMRDRARVRAAALRRTAGLHEDAAESLEHHADEVDRLKELIAAIEHQVRSMVEGARDRLTRLAGSAVDGIRSVLPDPVDELLSRFVPPVPGSRAWLDVDVPGLR